MCSINTVMWMDCLMNFLLLSLCDFSSFILICPHFLWFVWTFCDLFGFFLIYLDFSWFVSIFPDFCDLLWFIWLFCDLFWFLLIWVNTLCIVTHFCHTPHYWNVLKKWWEMMFIWCGTHDVTCLSLFVFVTLHKCDHMILHIFEHFYQILYT